jgi:hypothetical protein
MKKTHWLLIFIGGIVLWAGMILCCMIVLQFGSESFSQEELIDASEEAYRFDPQTILTGNASGDNIFVQIPFPEKFPKPFPTAIFWRQKEYLQVIDLFMEDILRENRNSWELISIGSTRSCSGMETELQNFGIDLQKSALLSNVNHRIEFHIGIAPQIEMVTLLRREYAPDEGGYRTIAWNDIVIPAEQALLIAEQNGGAVVRQALGNQCRITISLTAGIQKNDWWIDYEPLNEPSVFEIAVDEKTGKYRILREFKIVKSP